jgi:hypothetical protein
MGVDGIERVVGGLGRAVAVVNVVRGDAAALTGVLAQLGWAPPPGAVDLVDLMTLDASPVISALETLAHSTAAERADTATMAVRYAAVGAAVATLTVQIGTLADGLPAKLSGAGDWVTKTRIVQELPQRLLDFLVTRQAQLYAPLVHSLLKLAGIFRVEAFPADATVYQVAHVRAIVEWGNVPKLFSDPVDVMRTTYGWGKPVFEADELLVNVADVLAQFGARSRMAPMPPALEQLLTGAAAPLATTDPNPRLIIELLDLPALGIDLSMHRLRATSPGAPDAGLELIPIVRGGMTIAVPIAGGLSLLVDAGLDLVGGVALGVRPGKPPTLRTGFDGGAPTDVSGRFGLGIKLAGQQPGDRLVLLRLGDSGQVDLTSFTVLAGAELDAAGVDPYVLIDLEQLRLRIGAKKADGFVGSKLPDDGSGVTLDLRLRWSQRDGLHVEGAAAVEIRIPINKTLGFVTLASVHITAKATTAESVLRFEAGVTGDLALGPVRVSIDDIGVRAKLLPEPGNLGPIGLDVGFKPPAGLGISVKAGPVTGGGYVFFDPDNEQYAGVLQLGFKAITVTAIGLLTTRLPDASGPPGATKKGFSLLVIIAVEFPPIQLGYGFALIGVGGLLGINRTMVIDPLRNGVRDGTVNAILFPQNVVARAPQIISQLRSIFPPADGRYVFGPMVKIGWGPNSLITLEAALILELMMPIRLVILGRIQIALPDRKDPVLNLRLDIVGVIDFDRGEISIDASLVDSKLVVFAITGDMAVRVGWGATKMFVVAAGGFHPKFQPPAGFPTLRRLGISLATGDNPRLRLECYMAMTANTIQFGALLDMYVKVDTFAGTFSAAANLTFDALIQFQPFELMADLSAGIDIELNRKPLLHAALCASLTGPTPWHAIGYAEFDFLGRHRIDVEATSGPDAQPPVVRIDGRDVLAEITKAFARSDAWAALPPQEGERVVGLRDLEAGAAVVVHPLGALSARQRVVPFGVSVDRFGTAVVPPTTFTLEGFLLSGGGGVVAKQASDLSDDFAPGQFTALTDDERVARPAFESLRSGGTVPVPGFRVPADRPAGIAASENYEESVVDVEPATGVRRDKASTGRVARLPVATVNKLAFAGAAALAETRTAGATGFRGPDLHVEVTDERYVVAETDTLVKDAGARPESAAEAADRRGHGAARQVVLAREAG